MFHQWWLIHVSHWFCLHCQDQPTTLFLFMRNSSTQIEYWLVCKNPICFRACEELLLKKMKKKTRFVPIYKFKLIFSGILVRFKIVLKKKQNKFVVSNLDWFKSSSFTSIDETLFIFQFYMDSFVKIVIFSNVAAVFNATSHCARSQLW